MILAVYRHLQDTSRAFIAEEDVQSWLNEAQLDAATRLRLLRGEKTGTTTASTIPLSIVAPDVLTEIQTLHIGGYEVLFVSDDEFDDYRDNGATPSVTIGRIFDGNIELYPAPTTGTAYVLRYVREPAAMVEHSDTSELPSQHHRKLVAFAASEALYQDGNFTLADRKKAEYERGLPDPPTGLIRLQPGPFSLSFAGGPFDTEDAKHL